MVPLRGHPEVRAFCGPKDLCNPTGVAPVLRFAQDDNAIKANHKLAASPTSFALFHNKIRASRGDQEKS
jgi:hypothetical protein